MFVFFLGGAFVVSANIADTCGYGFSKNMKKPIEKALEKKTPKKLCSSMFSKLLKKKQVRYGFSKT